MGSNIIISKPKPFRLGLDQWFKSLLNELEPKTDEIFPNSIFYMKDGITYFEYDKFDGSLSTHYDMVLRVLSDKYRIQYDEIYKFIKVRMEEHFNLSELNPRKGWVHFEGLR